MNTLLYIFGFAGCANFLLAWHFRKLRNNELNKNHERKSLLRDQYEPLVKSLAELETNIRTTIASTANYIKNSKIAVSEEELTKTRQEIHKLNSVEIPQYRSQLYAVAALAAPILLEIRRRAEQRRREEEERRQREASSSSGSSYRGGGGRSGGGGASGGW